MEECVNIISRCEQASIVLKRPQKLLGSLLVLLVLFISFYTPQAQFSEAINPAVVNEPTPLKAPTIEANNDVKFITRAQSIYKLTNGNEDKDTDAPQGDVISTESLLKSSTFSM